MFEYSLAVTDCLPHTDCTVTVTVTVTVLLGRHFNLARGGSFRKIAKGYSRLGHVCPSVWLSASVPLSPVPLSPCHPIPLSPCPSDPCPSVPLPV